MNAFLDAEELRQLTGRSRKSAQVAQLEQMGVRYLVNAQGYPVVARSAIDGFAANEPSVHASEPDWSKIK